MVSCFYLAERGGFEPPVPCGTQTFQACTIGHSDTSPLDCKNRKSLVFDNFHFNPNSALKNAESNKWL